MTDAIEIIRNGSCTEIHLNRPERKNALTGAMYTAIAAAFEAAEEDRNITSVLIAANGDTFCAGNDLNDFMAAPPSGGESPVARFLKAISTSTKIIIAAVQGPAVGVGGTMLLHCDHVVAAEHTSIHFSFVKMALVPEAASSLLLPRIIGHLRAAELMLTGDPVAAEDACRLGLINHVVGKGEQLAHARAFAAKLDDRPPEALLLTKALLKSASTDVAARMAEEGKVFADRLRSPEFRESATAFMEKRKPNYKGLQR